MPTQATTPFQYRAECGACGHRRAWFTGKHYSADGQEIGTVGPNQPRGVLDDPCPACGTTNPQHVRRDWHGPHAGGIEWRYVGVAQPAVDWRVPYPTGGDWPAPVQLPDEWAPPLVVMSDPRERADVARPGQQIALF